MCIRDRDADEVNDYFALNVEPTARPLVINVDYNEATFQITKDIQSVMSGMRKEESLSAIEKSYYDAAEKFIQGKSETAEDLSLIHILRMYLICTLQILHAMEANFQLKQLMTPEMNL